MAKGKATAEASADKKTRNIAADILTPGSKGAIIKAIGLGACGLHCDETTKNIADKEKRATARKTENNKIAPKWSNKTLSRLALSETGEQYNKLKSLAKAAAPDISKNNYSGSVKEFVQFMINYGGTGARANKDRSGLADLAKGL